MLIIGLTGGIAAGKTTVVQCLKGGGQVVIDCDEIAYDVVKVGRWGYKRLVKAFGADFLLPSGEVNREKLGLHIFNNPAERRKLNAATHLPVGVELVKRVLWQWLLCKPMVWVDMPLLFETGAYKWMSCNAVVRLDTETQIARLAARDRITTEAALTEINSQMPLEAKLAKADDVIDNTGTVESTKEQVSSLIQRLKADPSYYLGVLVSPAGLCCVAVFLAAIASEVSGSQTQQSGPFIV